MTVTDILSQRLSNQRLLDNKFKKTSDAISWFGAVQAQDYPGAKWGVGQRIQHATDQTIEDAFNKGEILRTHVMRPTWHFIHPKDARWMLELTGPRVKKLMGHYNKLLELDDTVFQKTEKLFIRLLQGKKALTRQELKTELDQLGIKTNVQRLAHIVMQAELDCIIISGPKKGKQFTYMLFEERIEKTKSLSHDEALAELTKRYFQSHGPALNPDFGWWSGLTFADVKKGINLLGSHIQNAEVDGRLYFFMSDKHKTAKIPSEIYLLPNYDEFGIAYKFRDVFTPKEELEKPKVLGSVTFAHLIMQKGRLIGMWKRTINTKSVGLESQFFEKPSESTIKQLRHAASLYEKFLGIPVQLKI